MIPSYEIWLEHLTSIYYQKVKDCFLYPCEMLLVINVLYSMGLSESLFSDGFQMISYLLINFSILIGTFTEHLLPKYKNLALLFIFETMINLCFAHIYYVNPAHPKIYVIVTTLISEFFIYFINIHRLLILLLQMKNLICSIYIDMILHDDYSFEPISIFLVVLVVIINIRLTISRDDILRILYTNHMQILLANEKLSTIINSMPVGIIVLSLDLKIILYNNTFKQKFGVNSKLQVQNLLPTLKYSSGRRVYSDDDTEQYLINDIHSYMKNLDNPPTTFGIVERNQYYYEWRANMTLWENFHAIILTARNVTSLIHLEKSRAEAGCRNAMLRSVSHELRTPTAIISSSAEQITEDTESRLSDFAKDSLNIINVCAKVLLNIIHDLIDFSQIVSGKFSIVKMKFSIQDLLNECIFLIYTQCRKKNIQFEFILDPHLPTFAVNDANRIRQVVLNLLTNALKFTFKGKITLKAKLHSSWQAKITVSDTGTGISQDSIQKLFRLFSNVNEECLNVHGCGLGLHISSLIVQKLGTGGIKVKSTEDQGSKFSFLFDLGPNDRLNYDYDSEMDQIPSEADTGSLINIPSISVKISDKGKHTKILIVDDNEFNRKILCHFLDVAALKYDEACNGVEAVDIIRKKNRISNGYKVIIMDCQMPKMDGWTATSTIHSLFNNQEIEYLPSIVGYTAYTGTEEIEKCIKSGMVDCLHKPTSRDKLLSVIKFYLDS